jgi:hypothetical protein
MLPDTTPRHLTQLTLPLDPASLLSPSPPLHESQVRPENVWTSLSVTTQDQLRLIWRHVLREVLNDHGTR